MLKKNWAFADWWLFVFFNYATWSIVQNLVCSLDCLCSIHYALPNMFCLVVKIHNVVKINKTSNLFTILYFQLFLCKDINEDCASFKYSYYLIVHWWISFVKLDETNSNSLDLIIALNNWMSKVSDSY